MRDNFNYLIIFKHLINLKHIFNNYITDLIFEKLEKNRIIYVGIENLDF